MRMRGLLVVLICFGLSLSLTAPSQAAEPMREFLDGLRSRQYFDWAMLYLDQLQDRADLSSDLRALIPYERAMTLNESARHTVSPETQQRQLDQALGFLEQFTKESPRHPLAATANSTRANILLSKARVDILQSKLPSNKDGRTDFQDRAREQVRKAHEVFQKAHDGYKLAWEAFPKFIDKAVDPTKHEARGKAEVAYMRAQLDLALCQFEEAQTHDRNSTNHGLHLKKSLEMFREVWVKYRATVGGLHAQMWEAKCYEEMDDPQRALGIYAELLGHPADGLKPLQDQVRHFRLICLNHDQRREYANAIVEADDWIKAAKPIEQRSQAGQGIRWELVVAMEKLADLSNTTAGEKDKLLRQAVTHLTQLSKWSGPYRDLAQQRIRDLNLRQRGKDGSGDPKDFDSALVLGRDLMKRVNEKKTLVDAAGNDKRPRDEVEKLRADFQQLLKEQIRVLRLALSFKDQGAPRAEVNQTRYFLAYGYYLADRPYESAIAAEAVAFGATKDKLDEQTALDAAYLGVAAYIKGFNQTPNEVKVLREVDTAMMVRLANFITGKWPSHTKANETRMLVGRTFGQMEQPQTAAEWYLKVPETAEIFPEAQCAAGHALWQQYLTAALIEDATQRASPEELTKWRTDAEKSLKLGIERTLKKNLGLEKTPDELIVAKTSLAEILLTAGEYESAIDVIQKPPHAVLTAIAVSDEKRRPAHPNVRSARFASHVFQLQLRGRVGLQQLDAAREVMAQLEQLAEHSGGADAITAVYVQLGRELEKELGRLKGAGNQQRFDEVRHSFEEFLDAMYQRPDQNFSSMTWIAETYYGLAQSTGDNAKDSGQYFERAAATYQSILERAKQEQSFADKDRLSGIRLRLVNCKRRQGDFKGAESSLKSLLVERPRATDVQFEAAYVWHDQGISGKTDFLKKALQGGMIGDKARVWGWNDLSMRLQRLVSDGRPESKERYGDKLFEAWYNTSLCRQKLGLAQASTSKKQAELETAKQVIQTFVQITGDFPNDWWKKFDRLYRQIQVDLGQAPNPLERPKEIVIASATTKKSAKEGIADATATDKANPKTKEERVAAKKTEESSPLGLIVFGLIVVGGGGFAAWLLINKKPRSLSVLHTPKSDDVPLFAVGGEPDAGPVFEMPEFAAPRKPVKKPVAGKPARPKGNPQ